MTTMNDRRLIEDYLPVDWLSAEASGEPRTKGHISTLHLWRARRPLVACRAAIYSALVDAPGSSEGRERQESFLKELCRWGASANVVQQARRRISDDRDATPPRSRLLCRRGRDPARSPPPRLRCLCARSESGRLPDPQGDLRIPAALRPFPVR